MPGRWKRRWMPSSDCARPAVKVLVGGDYGLNITPHGTYAKDLEYFVGYFGLSPTEAMLCATRDGGGRRRIRAAW